MRISFDNSGKRFLDVFIKEDNLDRGPFERYVNCDRSTPLKEITAGFKFFFEFPSVMINYVTVLTKASIMAIIDFDS